MSLYKNLKLNCMNDDKSVILLYIAVDKLISKIITYTTNFLYYA